jgi:type II secretory pathway predicted ATPase ExeA
MIRLLLETLPALQARVMLRVMTEEEARTMIAAMLAELDDTSQHIYTDFMFWYAQKPQASGASYLSYRRGHFLR